MSVILPSCCCLDSMSCTSPRFSYCVLPLLCFLFFRLPDGHRSMPYILSGPNHMFCFLRVSTCFIIFTLSHVPRSASLLCLQCVLPLRSVQQLVHCSSLFHAQFQDVVILQEVHRADRGGPDLSDAERQQYVQDLHRFLEVTSKMAECEWTAADRNWLARRCRSNLVRTAEGRADVARFENAPLLMDGVNKTKDASLRAASSHRISGSLTCPASPSGISH